MTGKPNVPKKPPLRSIYLPLVFGLGISHNYSKNGIQKEFVGLNKLIESRTDLPENSVCIRQVLYYFSNTFST